MRVLLDFFSNRHTLYAIARFCYGLLFIAFATAKFNDGVAISLAELVKNHPLLHLGPLLLGNIGFSYLLGCVEFFCAVLIFSGFAKPRLGFYGGLLAIITFLTTLSLLFFVPIWIDNVGAPFVNSRGEFLFKDFGLLAAAIMLTSFDAQRIKASQL